MKSRDIYFLAYITAVLVLAAITIAAIPSDEIYLFAAIAAFFAAYQMVGKAMDQWEKCIALEDKALAQVVGISTSGEDTSGSERHEH